MADTLTRVRSDLEKRLKELDPLVQEHAHVRHALDALKGAGSRIHRPSSNGASRRVVAKADAATRRGRPSRSRVRAQEALKLVEKHPGITIAELAKKMKIKANYLYRVLPQLEKAGKVRRHEKGYHKADD